MLEAASNGASSAINLVLGIIANLVAFVSFMALLNGIVNWLGCLIGFDDLSFEWIFGKLFVPLAYIIGIPWNDCENVAKIIATKTIVNEFVAYERLGKMKIDKLISVKVNKQYEKNLIINWFFNALASSEVQLLQRLLFAVLQIRVHWEF